MYKIKAMQLYTSSPSSEHNKWQSWHSHQTKSLYPSILQEAQLIYQNFHVYEDGPRKNSSKQIKMCQKHLT